MYRASCANVTLIACWAANSNNPAGCARLEQELRACMDAPVCAPPLD